MHITAAGRRCSNFRRWVHACARYDSLSRSQCRLAPVEVKEEIETAAGWRAGVFCLLVDFHVCLGRLWDIYEANVQNAR